MPDPPAAVTRWLVYLLIFGLYLTLRGYHCRDGDQAYRLPLLLHRQDPALFADDPFVKAFDKFNPHRGSLALLDMASRPLGLSAGLFGLFALTFGATCVGIDRLARAVWPEAGSRVGVVAVGLVLIAKAGNVGTNHLFEAMLLDRLMAFSLGWLALACAVARPDRGWWLAPIPLGLAALIHPSVGLQLALLLGAGWIGWGLMGVGWRRTGGALALLAVALLPGMAWNLGQGGKLLEGLPVEDFRRLAVEEQGPQHMLPQLWRRAQWLAWGCYPVLALLAMRARPIAERRPARSRLAVLLALNLVGLGAARVAVEAARDLRITLFQPFRMATIARGLALALIAGRVVRLWQRGGLLDRARAAMLVAGLSGDWALVVATLFDAGMAGLDAVSPRSSARPGMRCGFAATLLGGGFLFLVRHDTEAGHWPLLGALMVALVGRALPTFGGWKRWAVPTRRRLAFAMAVAWAVPALAFIAVARGDAHASWARPFVARCRFAAVPTDDVERLAVWCRDHTPSTARFIGPPGPKTFRLWSLRSVAFNRAASPYHAAGLADWSTRYRDHVGFKGSTAEFVRAYQADRHGLERGYQELTDAERAALAGRQGASHVVAAAPEHTGASDPNGPLELLHVEGRYAVYRVRSGADR